MNEHYPITHVAIRFRGKLYSLPRPNRHYHVIVEILKQNPDVPTVDSNEQGFLDESGRFLNRKQAIISAQLFDQLIREPTGGILTSEDVW
jgi:hypothetical protein